MANIHVLLLMLCTLGLYGQVTTGMVLPHDVTSSSESPSDDEKSLDITSSLDRLEIYLYDLKDKLEHIKSLYEKSRGYDILDDDDRSILMKRMSPSSGFYGARGRRTYETAGLHQPGEHGNIMSLLDYYRAVKSSKRAMLDETNLDKRQGPPFGFHAARGRRSVRDSQGHLFH